MKSQVQAVRRSNRIESKTNGKENIFEKKAALKSNKLKVDKTQLITNKSAFEQKNLIDFESPSNLSLKKDLKSKPQIKSNIPFDHKKIITKQSTSMQTGFSPTIGVNNTRKCCTLFFRFFIE